MEPRPQISVLYLGRRGGGAKFALQVAQNLESSLFFELKKFVIRKDNELHADFDASNISYLFHKGISVNSLLKICLFFFRPKSLLNRVGLKPGDVCVVPMISPLGTPIEHILEKKAIRVIRFIHDARTHPGDRWPSSKRIMKLIKSSKVLITLSPHVTSQILEISPEVKIIEYPHPVFEFSKNDDLVDVPGPYILFIGRIREYKGVSLLIEAFAHLPYKDIYLIIAGEGKLSRSTQKNILLLNRWLLEEEISKLIFQADVIAFPYIESSQSGILPYCMSENKKIVILPSPGLVSQSRGYANLVISKDFSSEELAKALQFGLEKTPVKTKKSNKTVENVEKSIMQALYFLP